MTLERQPRRRERVLAEQVDGETVLLDLDSGLYFSLNETGARVWELCDGERDIAQIIDVITTEYDAPADSIRADVLELVTQLSDEELLISAAAGDGDGSSLDSTARDTHDLGEE